MSVDYDLYKSQSIKAGIKKGKITDEFMFTLDVVNIFLFENNIGISDIQEGFVDGKSDGGIDFIYFNDDSMTLIQGKSSDKISKDDTINAINKIIRTIKDFDNNEQSKYSQKLISAYLNAIDSAPDDSIIKIIFSTNSVFSDNIRNQLEKEFEKDDFIGYDIVIYDKTDIEDQRLLLNLEKEYVSEDKLILSEAKNVLKYKDKGFIVNVKASSIKKLYQKHTRKGLFSYNLREHIANKNVDTGITETINNDRENFWFYNNGITIACNDCKPDGYTFKLWDFSIINGAQTTTKIGESPLINEQNDFSVICKIVKSDGSSLKESDSFISKISQASNSQKPIIPRDLKANAKEQKRMQLYAAKHKNPLCILIKRGVKPDNFNKVEKWQRVKNEDIGQLILCCVLQRPGTARSDKRKIFENEKLYKQLFFRTMDYDTLYDLVRLSNFYNCFKVDYTKSTDDVSLLASCHNGKFVILALIAFLIKKERSIVDGAFDTSVIKDNLDNTLISNYKKDDFEKKLQEVFKYLVKELRDLYERKANELKLTSYSNFFKTDKTYQSIILPEIEKVFYEDEFNLDRLTKYMELFDS